MKDKKIRLFLKIGLVLLMPIAICIYLMIYFRNINNFSLAYFLGLTSFTLIFCASLFLCRVMVYYLPQKIKLNEIGKKSNKVSFSGEYIATYSRKNKIVGITLSLSLLIVSLFFLVSNEIKGSILAGLIFIFVICTTISVVTTKIVFQRDRIIAHKMFSRKLEEHYNDIKNVSVHYGTLRIDFSSGRSLKIHPGLGDVEIMIRYLSKF